MSENSGTRNRSGGSPSANTPPAAGGTGGSNKPTPGGVDAGGDPANRPAPPNPAPPAAGNAADESRVADAAALKSANDAAAAFEQQAQAVAKERDELRTQLDTLTNERDDLQEELDAANATITELRTTRKGKKARGSGVITANHKGNVADGD